MEKTAPIYIAGHTGLIGSALVRLLKTKSYSNVITKPRSELDLTQQAQVDAFFDAAKPEVVFLAAGRVGGIIENKSYPADFITTNLALQLNVLRAAQRTNVKKFIFFGSSCMYPRECPQPMTEEMLLTGKPEPTSLSYSIAKLAGLHTCIAYNQQHQQTNYVPVIPNTAYGPWDNFDPNAGHVLPALIKKFHDAKTTAQPVVELWGTGNPRREFVFSDDIADACYFLLQSDISLVDFPINIGIGKDYSIKELAEIIAKTVNYQGDIHWNISKPDGAPRKLLDSSKIHKLGWQPKVDLETGVAKTYKWFLENKVR